MAPPLELVIGNWLLVIGYWLIGKQRVVIQVSVGQILNFELSFCTLHFDFCIFCSSIIG